MFWAHRDQLLGSERDSLPDLVAQIVSQGKVSSEILPKNAPTPVTKVDGQLLLCSISEIPVMDRRNPDNEEIAYLILSPSHIEFPTSSPWTLSIPLTSGKKGQAEFLQSVLPQSLDFIHKQLTQGKRICVACESGKDSSVGVVLAALQLFFTDSGHLALPAKKPNDDNTKRRNY